MNIYSKRGDVTLIILGVIGLIGLGGWIFSTNPSTQQARWHLWAKTPVAIAQKADAKVEVSVAREAQTQGQIDDKTKALLGKVQESAVAADQAAGETVKTAATGRVPVKEAETTKTLTAQTVNQLNTVTGNTVDPARVTELEGMVRGLNAGLATAQTALESMREGYDTELAARKKLEGELAQEKANTSTARLEAKDANAQAQEWGLQRDAVAAKYEKLKYGAIALVSIVALGWIASIIFPLLAKAFPAFEAPAKLIGAVWAPGVQAVSSGAQKLATDLVAMHEYTKTVLAKQLSPEQLATYKDTISKDWMTVSDGSAKAVEAIKKTIRA